MCIHSVGKGEKMAEGTFATVINCMDGRTQEPVTTWMKNKFSVDYVDTITIPGADRALTRGSFDEVKALKEMVGISVNKHGSQVVAIVGHHDCAGNPVDKEMHVKEIKQAMEKVDSWGYNIGIVGLWVDESWQVEVIGVLE
jgi:hypothetical protein